MKDQVKNNFAKVSIHEKQKLQAQYSIFQNGEELFIYTNGSGEIASNSQQIMPCLGVRGERTHSAEQRSCRRLRLRPLSENTNDGGSKCTNLVSNSDTPWLSMNKVYYKPKEGSLLSHMESKYENQANEDDVSRDASNEYTSFGIQNSTSNTTVVENLLDVQTSTGQNTSSLPLCFLVQESLTARKPREGMPTLEKERSWSNYFGYWLD